MKKILLLVATLAMLMLSIAPAIASHEDDDRDGMMNQNASQEAESGDVNQSFEVSNTGDNSNQCAGVQGVANTGNAQNQVQVMQYGSEGDLGFEDVGSSIEVSPSNSTECNQSVNQTATAY